MVLFYSLRSSGKTLFLLSFPYCVREDGLSMKIIKAIISRKEGRWSEPPGRGLRGFVRPHIREDICGTMVEIAMDIRAHPQISLEHCQWNHKGPLIIRTSMVILMIIHEKPRIFMRISKDRTRDSSIRNKLFDIYSPRLIID